MRRTTAEKSRLAEQRKKERDIKMRMMKEIAAKKNVTEVRRLTQAELIKEAEETEKLNTASLGESTPNPLKPQYNQPHYSQTPI